jgi:hypothetical protein
LTYQRNVVSQQERGVEAFTLPPPDFVEKRAGSSGA